MTTLTEGAFAKINLTLDVLDRREDGYHDIRSILQTVALRDDIELLLDTGTGWHIECETAGIPLDDEHPDIVVIGFDTTLTYQKMWDVCNFVRAGLPYIATHPDFNCPTETGFMPDIGAIMRFIEAYAA